MSRKLIPSFDDGYTEEQREKIRAVEQDAVNRKAKGETCGNCYFFKAKVTDGRCLASKDGIKNPSTIGKNGGYRGVYAHEVHTCFRC
jgi:hypothetical protein